MIPERIYCNNDTKENAPPRIYFTFFFLGAKLSLIPRSKIFHTVENKNRKSFSTYFQTNLINAYVPPKINEKRKKEKEEEKKGDKKLSHAYANPLCNTRSARGWAISIFPPAAPCAPPTRFVQFPRRDFRACQTELHCAAKTCSSDKQISRYAYKQNFQSNTP